MRARNSLIHSRMEANGREKGDSRAECERLWVAYDVMSESARQVVPKARALSCTLDMFVYDDP